MAANYNIVCDQGATFDFRLKYFASENNPVNLNGWTANLQVRSNPRSSVKLLDLSTANGSITLGGSQGTVAVEVPAATTATLPVGRHYYDLELKTGPRTVRLLQGRFRVDAEVTR